MSLEDKIDALIEALNENTKAHLGSESAPAEKKPAAKKTSAKKPAAKKAEITVDTIAKEFGAYMKAGDEDDRATAKANVKALIDHFDTDRLTNLDPDNFAEAMDMLKAFKAGENPLGGEEEDDDDLM